MAPAAAWAAIPDCLLGARLRGGGLRVDHRESLAPGPAVKPRHYPPAIARRGNGVGMGPAGPANGLSGARVGRDGASAAGGSRTRPRYRRAARLSGVGLDLAIASQSPAGTHCRPRNTRRHFGWMRI